MLQGGASREEMKVGVAAQGNAVKPILSWTYGVCCRALVLLAVRKG
jgi:hypothetical protein